MGPGGRPQYEKKPQYSEAMKKPTPMPIELLFQRYPALSGFSIRGLDDVPDNCSRSGDDDELFVSDIGILPSLTTEQYGEIFQEIASTLSDLLAEHPEVTELLENAPRGLGYLGADPVAGQQDDRLTQAVASMFRRT